jgi:hypothetical protein
VQAELTITREAPIAGTTAEWHWYVVVAAEAENEIPQFEMSGFSETKSDARSDAKSAVKQWYVAKKAREETPVEVTTLDLDAL